MNRFVFRSYAAQVVWCCVVSVPVTHNVHAGGGPHNVVVLIDPQSDAAKQVGHHYQMVRGIPDVNVIYMDPAAASYQTFADQHRRVLLGTLEHRGISEHIDYIVIPAADDYFVPASGIVRDFCSPVNRFSLSSVYTMVHLTDELLAGAPNVSLSSRNHYFSDTGVPISFSSAKRWRNGEVSTTSGRRYLIGAVLGFTGERGNSVSEIINMIDRTVLADGTRPVGTTYFMETTDQARSGPRHGGFSSAVDAILGDGGNAEHLLDVLPVGRHDCLGIMTGWAAPGIVDADLSLLAGSFCDHFTSYAANFSTASQEKVSAWITKGASGSYGTVEEPCNYSGKFPTAQLHPYYFKGCSLGEAVFRSVRYVPFQGLLYGDPLARPFAFIPSVTIENFPVEEVSGSIDIRALVTNTAPQVSIARLDLLIEGVLFASSEGVAPFQLDTHALPDGCHDVSVSARDDSIVESTGYWFGSLCTRNHGREAGLIVTPLAGNVGTAFEFSMSGSGADVAELRLKANGRVIASAKEDAAVISLLGADLGPGALRFFVEAEFADGSLARSARISVDVEATGTASPNPGAPVAFGYRKTIPTNEPTVLELPATNPDGTALSYVISQLPTQADCWSHGSVLFLHPRPQASGIDSLAFYVTDGEAASPPASIILDYRHVYGDFTGDAHVDLHDFQRLQSCFGASLDGECERLGIDLNESGEIDLSDAAIFIESLTGPN